MVLVNELESSRFLVISIRLRVIGAGKGRSMIAEAEIKAFRLTDLREVSQ